ncbi:MAG: hypothetical protein MJ009_00880 [Paludibacteraceae bacterium]|nr:hypothetical protein [Paludibacteraceae bacterium]
MSFLRRINSILFGAVVVCAIVVSMVSCEADKINTSSDIRLSFSADTVRYDTIFTAQGSATRKLKIYNTSKNKVKVSSIGLADATAFEMNLDGRKGTSFSDVIINANDSMVAFIQVNINPTDAKTPFFVRDSIRFLTNGNEQFVRLEAYGRNAKRFYSHTLKSDTTITGEIAILVYDTLRVAKDVRLKISDGATIYFRNKAVLLVDGTLDMEGTQAVPVTLRGERSDFMNTNPPLNYDNASNQWGGVRFTSTSSGNSIVFADIRNSSFGVQVDSLETASGALRIENSKIYNSGTNLISSVNADVKIFNSLLYSAGGNILSVTGGSLDVRHCTIANYYNYTWGGRTASNVRISSVTACGTEMPVNALFYNTIIYGNYTDEIVFGVKEGLESQCVCSFNNCLVRENVSGGDERFKSCIINEAPKFIYESWSDEYKKVNPHLYDFHLTETSPAIGKADYSISKDYPNDLDGKYRLDGEQSDIGCYEN